MTTTATPHLASGTTATRPVRWWPAVGPGALAVLLAIRTLVGDGLAPAIGLSIAAVLVGAAIIAPRRDAWSVPGLLLGPISLLASPAATELSFNIVRPDDSGWFALTIAMAAACGVCLAAAAAAIIEHRIFHTGAPLVAVIGALGFAGALIVADPQPDLGSGLDATTRAALPEVVLVNYSFGLPADELIVDGPDGQRLRARLTNSSDLPHTLTIDELGVDVYVPAGREAFVDVEIETARIGQVPLRIVCTIGDHTSRGMVAELS